MTEQAYKEWGIVITTLLLSFIEFFGIVTLALPLPPSTGAIITLVIISIIWLVVMSLAHVLVSHPASSYVLILTPPILVVLAGRLSIGAWGGAILLIMSLVAARQYYLQEMKNRITYSTVQVFRYGTGYLVVGLMLAIAGLFLPGVQSSVSTDGIKISEQQVYFVLKYAQPMIGKFVPSFNAQDNVDQFIDAQITEQVGKGVAVPAEVHALYRAQIAKQFHQEISGKENMATIITRSINDILSSFTRSNNLIVSLVVIVLVFLTIRAFVPLIVWPLIVLIALSVWISNATGLSKLSNSEVTATRLQL